MTRTHGWIALGLGIAACAIAALVVWFRHLPIGDGWRVVQRVDVDRPGRLGCIGLDGEAVCDDQSNADHACALHLADNGEVTRECGDAVVMLNDQIIAATRQPNAASVYTIGARHLPLAAACGRHGQLFSNGETILGVDWRVLCWGSESTSIVGESCRVGFAHDDWIVGCHAGLLAITPTGPVTIAPDGRWNVVSTPSGVYAVGETGCFRWVDGQRESCGFRCSGELVASGDLLACSDRYEARTEIVAISTGAVVDTMVRRARVRGLNETHLLYSDGSGGAWLHQIREPSVSDELVFGTEIGWGGEGQIIQVGPSAAWLLGDRVVAYYGGELVVLRRE